MLRIIALLSILLPITAIAADQVVVLQPRVEADGRKLWRFVATWPLQYIGKNEPEPALNAFIAQKMGDHNWCLNGWEEVSREIVPGAFGSKNIIIEGRCK